jgi:hypothetical protein
MFSNIVKVIPIKTESTFNWKSDFLKQTFNDFHKENENIEMIDITTYQNPAYEKKSLCNTALDLIGVKNYLNNIDDCYILLLDSDLIFIKSIENLDLTNEVLAASFGFNRFHQKAKRYTRNFLEFNVVKNSVANFYKEKIDNNFNKKLNFVYDFPIFIKKSILSQIIDEWIELTFLLYSSDDKKSNPIKNQIIGYSFAFSLLMSKLEITPTVLDIIYFNNITNSEDSDKIFYDMKDDLTVNTRLGAKTFFHKNTLLGDKIYEYDPSILTREQNIFLDLINTYIIRHVIKSSVAEIIPV